MHHTPEIEDNAPDQQEPLVAILMATYNGSKYLQAQLESIARQSHRNWVLYASDDGSTDSTFSILQAFQQTQGAGRVHLLQGPRRGFAQNFLSLVRNRNICADYFAFCDQDDIWFEHKLDRAIASLHHRKTGQLPAFYCSRTRLIDERGRVIGYSRHFKRSPSFRNALVQSIAGANTIVLNKPARALLARVPTNAPVVSHDWLCYLLVSGNGGEVIYDATPSVDYRQHSSNLMGSNITLNSRIERCLRMFSGTFRKWNQDNLVVLLQGVDALNERNRQTALMYEQARQAALPQRFYLLKKAGVHRQTVLGTIGLMLAASIGKL
ncbi:glycosyltransferase family 2 protein [Pseudomonas sp. o96-267]|uniref:glycosyltransferase family 2 protein n=1 Tax=Pseudomonas sp. o96-267 TaxID=2479853 RepID=UPI0021156614|nr:glycosyltransferase family 2 protein [Pseudomonas sp. o96-267]